MQLTQRSLQKQEQKTLTNKTLTSPTLTTPKIADDGAITDADGNEQIIFQQTANAVNAIEVTNSEEIMVLK